MVRIGFHRTRSLENLGSVLYNRHPRHTLSANIVRLLTTFHTMTDLQLGLLAAFRPIRNARFFPFPSPVFSLVPIELVNGCSEEDCSIESDNHILTNALRRHSLEHFGHRNLDGIVGDYAEDAVLVHLIDGERKSFRGHGQIREAFVETFKEHPTVDSAFLLEEIVIQDRVGIVRWSARTPNHDYPSSIGYYNDTFRFGPNGKISKQFFKNRSENIQLETPWYVDGEVNSQGVQLTCA